MPWARWSKADLGAWTDYTPSLTQSGIVTKTVNHAAYVQVGKIVCASFRLSATGAGTGNVEIVIGLPVTARDRTVARVGSGTIYDSSAVTMYSCLFYLASTTTVSCSGDWSGGNAWGILPNVALASGDQVAGFLMYEAA